MATSAQKWANKRNRGKFRLNGILANLQAFLKTSDILTPGEREEIQRLIDPLKDTKKCWKGRNAFSKALFLRDIK